MGRKVGPVQLDSTWREQCTPGLHVYSGHREKSSLRSRQWWSLEMPHVAAGEKAGSQETGEREQTFHGECVCRHGLSTCR